MLSILKYDFNYRKKENNNKDKRVGEWLAGCQSDGEEQMISAGYEGRAGKPSPKKNKSSYINSWKRIHRQTWQPGENRRYLTNHHTNIARIIYQYLFCFIRNQLAISYQLWNHRSVFITCFTVCLLLSHPLPVLSCKVVQL